MWSLGKARAIAVNSALEDAVWRRGTNSLHDSPLEGTDSKIRFRNALARRLCNPAVFKRSIERILIDDGRSRDIDQRGARLHQRKVCWNLSWLPCYRSGG